MRRFSANYVLPVVGNPIKNGIVEVDDSGEVVRIISPRNNCPEEIHSTEFYNGVIVPGFVNAHCHLELSHLKGVFSKGIGLPNFVKQIGSVRESPIEEIQRCLSNALREASSTGTVAIGDISNCTHTIEQKLNSAIYFHNFIEVFRIDPAEAEHTMQKQIDVYESFLKCFPKSTTVAPHAPYTISDRLWQLMRPSLVGLTSIHFAECMAEYELLQYKRGDFFDAYSCQVSNYKVPTGGSPAELIMKQIPAQCELLLIHCTFAGAEEFKRLNDFYKKATFVTCPESNLFIEGTIANLELMDQLGLNIAIGTDSLASATTLSLLHNINLILEKFPSIDFLKVLKWATLNGANALNVGSRFGSIEVGKCPGLNLITNFNFDAMRPSPQSLVKPLI